MYKTLNTNALLNYEPPTILFEVCLNNHNKINKLGY